jgi:hypothetical protein
MLNSFRSSSSFFRVCARPCTSAMCVRRVFQKQLVISVSMYLRERMDGWDDGDSSSSAKCVKLRVIWVPSFRCLGRGGYEEQGKKGRGHRVLGRQRS